MRMSELGTYAPPPPPPPPPPQKPRSGSFDFVRPFTVVFEDPRWLPKVLVGGLFVLASAFLVGVFFLMGYLAQLVRNVVAGEQHPLPEWDNLGDKFSEGLVIFAAMFCYVVPWMIIYFIVMIPVIIAAAAGNHHPEVANAAGGMVGCVSCLAWPIQLAYMFWLPAATIYVMIEQRFGAAFQFGRIWNFIRANLGNYLLAVLVGLIAQFAAIIGLVGCGVGVLFTFSAAIMMAYYAYASVYRDATVR